VEAPSFLRRHPWARWLAPAAVVALAAMVTTGVFSSSSKPTSARLPSTTSTALIKSVRTAGVAGFSGTVVSRVSLGLPELPNIDGNDETATFASLLDGSHTLQIWYGGVQRERIAVLGPTDETDVFRSGRSMWQWDSADHVATHIVLPKKSGRATAKHAGSLVGTQGDPTGVLTPGGLAAQALSAISPDTRVQVRRGDVVADRSTYELVLTPKDESTLIGSVHIAVDGTTRIPLGVQIYPRGSGSPAVDVSYTSISLGRPSRANFTFSPPSGARVRQLQLAGLLHGATTHHRMRIVGSAWSTVLGYHSDTNLAAAVTRRGGLLARAFVPVSGRWGRGRMLQTKLLSVLLTDKGWVYVGAVAPGALTAAAASR
jgi:hypothetical protein